ncbi:hypothetical protein NZK35_32765, partial [Stieleria sp. ICT_E10.1]|uniref:hypothetical protein n=1 Tax=Stieleria sedimenti TaxID=2976331 RepID=UPI00217F7552
RFQVSGSRKLAGNFPVTHALVYSPFPPHFPAPHFSANCQLPTADCRLPTDLELGTWNLELGTWNLELGTWNLKLKTQPPFLTSNGTLPIVEVPP